MDYAAVKLVHQTAVALSIAGFFARGAGALAGAQWVAGRTARTVPHVVDTVLLASALTLAWMLRLTPGAAPWLIAKVIGLVVYVALGMIALRPGRSTAVRAAAWIAALATAGWIVSVAITKSPFGVFVHLSRAAQLMQVNPGRAAGGTIPGLQLARADEVMLERAMPGQTDTFEAT